MWVLNWLPDIAFHMMLTGGILLLIASWIMHFVTIPFITRFGFYELPTQIAGILLTSIAIWYEGGIAKDHEYRAQIHEMEIKLAAAEERAANVTAKIEYVTKEKIIRVAGEIKTIIQRINEPAITQAIDASCEVPQEAVAAANAAIGVTE